MTIVLMRVENLRGGARSLALWFGIFDDNDSIPVVGEDADMKPSFADEYQNKLHTSSSLPSILNCQAGIPSPVSKFTFVPSAEGGLLDIGSAGVVCCHA